MALDFSEFFKRYEAIIGEADQVFQAVRDKFSENVRCAKGCSDCCHALFDLTLVEALYLNRAFNAGFKGKARNAILERADEADRRVHKFKREAFKAVQGGKDAQQLLAEMAKVKVRCPLLSDQGLCELYDQRPVTCRIYGVPTAIGGQAHTCGKSAFEKGKAYPTVYLDRIQDKLYALSHELAATLNSSYKDLGEILVPASLALLTDYTEEYLGIKKDKPAANEPAKPAAKEPAKQAAKPAACAGCSPEAKPGGCAGCSPTGFTIGQVPKKQAKPAKPAAKAAAPKKTAKPAAKQAGKKV